MYRWISDKFFDPSLIKKHLIELDQKTFEERKHLLTSAFLENVRVFARTAKENGSKVILVTAVSNLMDTPPNAGVEQVYWSSAADFARASVANYQQGKALFKAGDVESAIDHFIKAKDTDLTGARVVSEMNQGLRDLAREDNNIVLIDLESLFFNEFKNEGVGCNLFGSKTECDGMHLNLRAKEFTARVIADAIIAMN